MQLDPAYLEELYEQWKQDPSSLDGSWQLFFQGFDLASCPRTCVASEQARDQSHLASLIYNYRDQGYLIADINPLEPPPEALSDLALDNFGFSDDDLDRVAARLGVATGQEDDESEGYRSVFLMASGHSCSSTALSADGDQRIASAITTWPSVLSEISTLTSPAGSSKLPTLFQPSVLAFEAKVAS